MITHRLRVVAVLLLFKILFFGCASIPYEVGLKKNPALSGADLTSEDPQVLEKFGFYSRAEKQYLNKIEQSPEAVQNRLRLASLYGKFGNNGEARAIFNSIAEQEPQNLYYMNNYSWFLITSGDYKDIAHGVKIAEQALSTINGKNLPRGAEIPLLDNILWGYFKLDNPVMSKSYFLRMQQYYQNIAHNPLLLGHYKTVESYLYTKGEID